MLTERELAAGYSTFDALRAHEDIARFITWGRGKHPELTTPHRWTKARKRR